MITEKNPFPWLALIDRPAFCVKNGSVVAVNSAAESRCISIGTEVAQIIAEHRTAYEEFQNGCLYLTVTIGNLPCSASVTRAPDCDIFVLSHDSDDTKLRALALAAQQLRIPLSNAMAVTDLLLTKSNGNDSSAQQANQINQALFQLLRIISNMSDAGCRQAEPFFGMHTADLTTVFAEIIEKAAVYAQTVGVKIVYTGLNAPIFSLADPEKLERAVYNLLSNAIKFSPAGETVEAKLIKQENAVSFTVCNTVENPILESNFWNQYCREPAVSDSRRGLGLGMTFVSAVAASHGGTVLVDHPTSTQTRVTLNIKIQKDNGNLLRSPVLRISDYAGGWDKALLEFSEILSADSYQKNN